MYVILKSIYFQKGNYKHIRFLKILFLFILFIYFFITSIRFIPHLFLHLFLYIFLDPSSFIHMNPKKYALFCWAYFICCVPDSICFPRHCWIFPAPPPSPLPLPWSFPPSPPPPPPPFHHGVFPLRWAPFVIVFACCASFAFWAR